MHQKSDQTQAQWSGKNASGFSQDWGYWQSFWRNCWNTTDSLSLSGRVQLDGVIYNNHTVYETVGVLLNSQSDVRTLVGIIRLGDVQEGCAEPHDQENYIRLRFLQIKAETQTNPPGLIQTSSAGSVSPDTGYFKSQNHQNNTNSSERVIEPEVRGQNYHRDHPVSQQISVNLNVTHRNFESFQNY